MTACSVTRDCDLAVHTNCLSVAHTRAHRPTNLPTNTCTHPAHTRYVLALVYDAAASSVTMYVDGKSAGTCNGISTKPSERTQPTRMLIGRSLSNEPYLPAELRCFRMYSRALR